MRMRISLFELLLLITPVFAVVLGLGVAAIKSPDSILVLTIAQSAYLLAMLAAVCAVFHRRPQVRTFGGAFLAASLGHLLLLQIAYQSAYSGSFPTKFILSSIWDQAYPGQNAAASAWTTMPGVSTIWTVPASGGGPGSGSSGGMGYSGFGGGPFGSTIPIYSPTPARPMFIDVGTWAASLLIGVLCGVVAKALHGSQTEHEPSPADRRPQ
jgi:hypothetical protein